MINTRITYNPLQSIMTVLSIIGMWKVFEDRGEQGWKALIPFYKTITFGKVCEEEGKAKRHVIITVLLLIALFALAIAFAFAYASQTSTGLVITDPNDINGIQFVQTTVDHMSPANASVILGCAAVCFLLLIALIISHIRLSLAFDRYNEGPSWMVILWIFVPAAAYLYYAFGHKTIRSPYFTDEDGEADDSVDQFIE